MELKDFIKVTLEQIVQGVSGAQESVEKLGGVVNPSNVDYFSDGNRNVSSHALPQEVKFNVGLTKSEKSGSAGGVGVFFAGISMGTRRDKSGEEAAITNVSFTVPLVLPPGKELVEKKK